MPASFGACIASEFEVACEWLAAESTNCRLATETEVGAFFGAMAARLMRQAADCSTLFR